ncbi:hypothetical protein BJV74DRAFT_821995 [Russula compacta]|nr:hypothetical protein BJV74DRAFT_821995 [Russula compacta]
MAAPGDLTLTVSNSDTSSVAFTGDWQRDAQDGSVNIDDPSDFSSVALAFHGTRAGAFGSMSFNDDTPLLGSITTGSGTPFNFTQPASSSPSQDQASFFYITDPMPCDEYILTLFVSPQQSMQIMHFNFAPCQLPTDGPPTATMNASTSSIATTSSTSASTSTSASASVSALAASASRRASSRTGLIVGLALGSLVFLLLLCGVVGLFLMWRRRPGSSSWFRLPWFRTKLSPSAQYFASLGGGDDDNGAKPGPGLSTFRPNFAPATITIMQDPSPSTKRVSSHRHVSPPPAPPPPPPMSPSSSLSSPPQRRRLHASIEKPPLGADGGSDADPESEMRGMTLIRGYLPDSKEWMARREGRRSESSTARSAADSVEPLPPYKPRASHPRT